jgi:tetratricopeptide (TPR) repeat protein/peroxiredoxin
MTFSHPNEGSTFSRRTLLKGLGFAPVLFRSAPLFGSSLFLKSLGLSLDQKNGFPFSDIRLAPHYPAQSPLADVFRLVPPGSDTYTTEKYAFEIDSILQRWSQSLKASPRDHSALTDALDVSIQGISFQSASESKARASFGISVTKRTFAADLETGRERFLESINNWLGPISKIETAEFEIFGIQEVSSTPLAVRTDIRYDFVASRADGKREERVGTWHVEWIRNESQAWRAHKWEAGEETLSVVDGPVFVDVTQQALNGADSYSSQMIRGADYWRTVLDGAIGVDVYGNNGIATGDFDNDGFDDIYVCQPAGLPNRLYRNRGDGTFEDVTEKAGVGVLDNTACALFADFENKGLQDLLVVCGTGPLLFLNQGNGNFALKRDAFKFAQPPQGTFTHAAVADCDRDGRLDIYLCTYMYYLGLDQYHYPVPYYDARNGPPNCLFHNEGNATFVETTQAAGLNVDNDRYSFACAWGDSNSNGLPDLFVANDFGTSQLYRNNGNETFTVVSKETGVEGVGAGMGCAWADFDNDGHQDVYVPSMWEAAGQRVSAQAQFHKDAPQRIRELYQRHARGNALYRNKGDGTFENVGQHAGVEMGRWSWSSDFWDFDHDGYSDLYVANGYLSGAERDDLASFFWRQIVAKSSEDATRASAYERGWNAINELVRSDSTWHGYARNVMFANNGNGTFSEVSGAVGLDFLEDSRSFALADIDHDGRLEVILKNRNAPQLRILHNSMSNLGHSISFRLRGHQSNRDAIGASVTIEAGKLRQTKYLQAGSGFLAQHSKELFFGVGENNTPIRASIRWPSGATQQFENLPTNNRIEIEEGSGTFSARPFDTTPAVYSRPATSPPIEPLPLQTATWLIEPLKAPEFSLPDLAGKPVELKSFRGNVVLLNFWESTAAQSTQQLKLLQQHKALLSAAGATILAVNVDNKKDAGTARSISSRLSFPILFATNEEAGVYNIIYRHLFDRRRDLAIPTSFLLDREGMIIRVYQGLTDPGLIIHDSKSVPDNDSDRMQKALPFAGLLADDTFQRNDFTYGVAMYQHGYLEQASQSFRDVIASKPNNADAYYNLGTLNLRKNDLRQAREYLETTVKLRPDYPEAWNNLGMIAAQQGQSEEAIEDFQKSLQLRPRFSIALLNLGNLYRRQRDYARAEQCLSQALETQPEDAETNYSLGMLYAQQNQMERASTYLQKALDIRPDYPEALNNLGVLFVRGQEYAKAEDQFKAGIRVAPNFDQSYLNLARLYAMRSDKEKAREVILDLLRVQPDNPSAKQALEVLQ